MLSDISCIIAASCLPSIQSISLLFCAFLLVIKCPHHMDFRILKFSQSLDCNCDAFSLSFVIPYIKTSWVCFSSGWDHRSWDHFLLSPLIVKVEKVFINIIYYSCYSRVVLVSKWICCPKLENVEALQISVSTDQFTLTLFTAAHRRLMAGPTCMETPDGMCILRQIPNGNREKIKSM